MIHGRSRRFARGLVIVLVTLAGMLSIVATGHSDDDEDDSSRDSGPTLVPGDLILISPADPVHLAPGDAVEIPLQLRTNGNQSNLFRLTVSEMRSPTTTETSLVPAEGSVRPGQTVDVILRLETTAGIEVGVHEVTIAEGLIASALGTARFVVLPVGGAVATGPVTEIAGGGFHSLAVLGDGTVWGWGSNGHGQLGNGTLASATVPTPVTGLPGSALGIAAGERHSVAVVDDAMWAWGDNRKFQAGTTDTGPPPEALSSPFQAVCYDDPCRVVVDGTLDVGPPPHVVAVAAGSEHSLALTGDGSVFAWGANSEGQVGRGETSTRSIGKLVPVADASVGIAGGGDRSLARAGDGTVYGWGDGDAEPVEVLPFVFDVRAMGAGSDHSLFALGDGTVRSLGANTFGQLGDGTRDAASGVPVQPPFLTGVVDVAGGFAHSLALTQQDELWAWGDNSFGQVGEDGDPMTQLVPIRVAGVSQVGALAAGGRHSLALDERCGQVWAWGDNVAGQLGTATVGAPGRRNPRPMPVYGLGEASLAPGCQVGLSIISQGDGEGTISTSPAVIADARCSIPCSAPFTVDTTVTITATPAAGSRFAGWHGDCTGSEPTTVVVMDHSRNCFVEFEPGDAGSSTTVPGPTSTAPATTIPPVTTLAPSECSVDGLRVVLARSSVAAAANGFGTLDVVVESDAPPSFSVDGAPEILALALVNAFEDGPDEWDVFIDRQTEEPFPEGRFSMHLTVMAGESVCSAPFTLEVSPYEGE